MDRQHGMDPKIIFVDDGHYKYNCYTEINISRDMKLWQGDCKLKPSKPQSTGAQ
jgi:hypothetical protein